MTIGGGERVPSKVKQTVQVSSHITKGCEECDKGFGPESEVAEQINHYLNHGYKLLHIGQETSEGIGGKIWQNTIAILGK